MGRHASISGMTKPEMAVMDRVDAGMRVRDIAAETGLTVERVLTIRTRYMGDDRAIREAAIRESSRQLGAAVSAYVRRRATQ